MNEKQRTAQQNKALHKYFELLAQALNDSGWDMRKTLKPQMNIPWNKDTIKDYLFRPFMYEITRKKHTANLTSSEIDQVWEVVNREIGEKTGLHVPFPSIEQLLIDEGKGPV